MKKIFIIVLFFSNLFASSFYFGMGVTPPLGYEDIKHYDEDGVLTDEINGDITELDYKIGFIDKSLNRTELVYSHLIGFFDEYDDIKGIELNRIVNLKSFSNRYVSPYVVSGLGIYHDKGWDLNIYGVILGLGTYMKLTKSIELDTFYKLKYMRNHIDDTGKESMIVTINGLYVGFNFKF